jgi:hypothetical protein
MDQQLATLLAQQQQMQQQQMQQMQQMQQQQTMLLEMLSAMQQQVQSLLPSLEPAPECSPTPAADRSSGVVPAVLAATPPLGPDAINAYVSLNVGGTRYTTLLATLMRHPDSMLAAMFRGLADPSPGAPAFELATDASGAYILDQDGPSFRFVLAYLRHEQASGSSSIPLPGDPVERELLAMEAEYLCLPALAAMCRATEYDRGATEYDVVVGADIPRSSRKGGVEAVYPHTHKILNSLKSKVTKRIAQGWRPEGGVMSGPGGIVWQAMVRF